MTTVITPTSITEDQFEATYKPLKNPFNPNASWGGAMLETYGKDLEHVHAVNKTDPGRVWTILDCDGSLVLCSGYSFVNRFGYIITEVPVPEGTFIEIPDDDAELHGDDEDSDED